MNLTSSQEDYIKAVYALSCEEDGTHVSDIAHRLEVSKASASVAVKSLQEKHLVRRDLSRKVFLTRQGEQQATLIMQKFEIIKSFLLNVLHIENRTAAADACAIEHIISPETLCSICSYLDFKCSKGCCIKTDVAFSKIEELESLGRE